MEPKQEHHQMELEKQYTTGAEEWHCPTCGRRFVMTWSPTFKRIILESGDEYAVHSGGKGIPGMVSPQLGGDFKKSPPHEEPTQDEQLSAPWEDWMESSDFDKLWDDQEP